MFADFISKCKYPLKIHLSGPTQKNNCTNTQKVCVCLAHLYSSEKSTKIPVSHTYPKFNPCKRRALKSLWFENEKSKTATDFQTRFTQL